MTNNNRNCWIAAAVLGLLVWVFTAGIGELSWLSGLVLGLITMGLFGAFLDWLLCRGAQAVDGVDWDKSSVRQSFVAQEAPKAVEAPAQRVAAEQVAPTGDAQVQSETTERPITARNDIYSAKPLEDGGDKQPAAAKPAAAKQTTAKAKAAVKKPAEKKTAAKQSTPKKKSAKPAAPKAASTTPADDLKEIKGIGPKLEELLHKNGVTHFSQIAGWSEKDIDHFADLIGRMGGRIRSDDWLGQARILADGGSTEFSKRVEKGDVYS